MPANYPTITNFSEQIDILLDYIYNAITGTSGNPAGIFAEDSAHANGDKGMHVLTVRNQTRATNTGADGDYASLSTNNRNELQVIAGGRTQMMYQIFTRPANTTAYAAEDVITDSTSASSKLTFSDFDFSGQSGYVTGARIVTNDTDAVPRFRLWLFTDSTISLPNDNAPFTFNYSDAIDFLGYIDFPAVNIDGTAPWAHAQNYDVRIPFELAGADNKLYGILETLDAFTPDSAQGFTIQLCCELN